jgi:hypothetical protein
MSRKKGGLDDMRTGIAWGVVFLALISVSPCYAGDLVFVRSTSASSTQEEQLRVATDFYGLKLTVIVGSSVSDPVALNQAIGGKDTLGVVVAADALSVVNRSALLHSLERSLGSNLPLLILGVGQDVDPALLKTWSGGAVSSFSRLASSVHPEYTFGRVNGFTLQLADLGIPVSVEGAFFLVLGENAPVQRIASLRDDHQVFPLFIETMVRQQKIFVASKMLALHGSSTDEVDGVSAFLRIAPEMMFVRYCAGERGWHVVHHYANFTIDDPWLRQPYGYLDYEALLKEMERHHFHTTIAFIPWNYNRSEPGVVSLFRDHPDRFSIAIHGNNHDHKEFTDYRSRLLDTQIGDLKQALARMEKFQELTGIKYDKVMIFPHSIAPEGTLGALKTYNYLATVNSSNVPQGAAKPTEALFDLRPVTVSFSGFPSFIRYPVVVPFSNGYIPINVFLDNSLLFYAHSDFFARGIDAFDAVADKVNKLEPDTQWRGLGDIVRHLYLVKLREDSNYDVLAFSNGITLDNTSGRDAIFYLQKREAGPQPIKSVSVEGQTYPYHLQDGYLTLSLTIPAGTSGHIDIQYQNNLDLATIDASHDSYVVYALRLGSDFRDIYLAKSKFGLALIRLYNDHNVKPWQVLAALLVLLICTFACYRWRIFVTRRRHALNEAWKGSPIGPTIAEHLESPPRRASDSTR